VLIDVSDEHVATIFRVKEKAKSPTFTLLSCCFSEMSVDCQWTKQHYVPEDNLNSMALSLQANYTD
jgi:hypothetical protein